MPTTNDYIDQLKTDKQTLVNALNEKGVEATSNETFTSLTPKVSQIQAGSDSSEYFKETPISSMSFSIAKYIKKTGNLDTSNITSMQNAFSGCENLEEIPMMNTSKVTQMGNMFVNCKKIATIPLLDTSKVVSMAGMFQNCTKLIDIPLLDTSKVTTMQTMIQNCTSLKAFPQLNTSKVTNFSSFAHDCSNLQSLPLLDFSSANNIDNAFANNSNLVNIGGFLNLGKAYTNQTKNYRYYRLSFVQSNSLTHDSLVNIINNLYDLNLTYGVANGGTLYSQSLWLGSENLTKLSEDEIAFAEAKGWTVS